MKHFFCISTSTLVKIGKTRNCVKTQFLVFPISTRVVITAYQHGKCFIFLKYCTVSEGVDTLKLLYNYSGDRIAL